MATIAGHTYRGDQHDPARAAKPRCVGMAVRLSDPTLADGRSIEVMALGEFDMAGVGVDRPVDSVSVQIATRVLGCTPSPEHVVSCVLARARTRDVLTDQLAVGRGRTDVVVLGGDE